MKPRRNTNRIQAKLFRELEPSSNPTTLDLSADQETEIKALIADLLLRLALHPVEPLKGAEHDQQADA